MSTIIFFIFYIFFTFTKQIRISGQIELPEPTHQRINDVTVSLIWGNQISHVNEKGYFYFDVPKPGYYLIAVNDDIYEYQMIFIDAKETEIKTYDYNYRFGVGAKRDYPYIIYPYNKYSFGDRKQNILSDIIRSPYAVMIGIGILLFVCMKSVNPEDLKAQQEEFRKTFQKFQGGR